MFATATKKNRVVTSALSVTYSVERRYETISGVKTYWYKVTRFAAKTYSYLDLTPAAAAEVMAAKVAKYTRTTRKCISRTLDKTFESLTTDISTSRNGSGSFNVDINVSETDSTHSASIPADPATLFTTENARDYDEGESGITVNSTTHDGADLTITISVTGELIGTLCSNVGLYYDGTRVTTGVTVYQSGEKAYKIVATNWESSHNTGTVRIGDSEADWQYEYVEPSITLDYIGSDYAYFAVTGISETAVRAGLEVWFSVTPYAAPDTQLSSSYHASLTTSSEGVYHLSFSSGNPMEGLPGYCKGLVKVGSVSSNTYNIGE